MTFGPLRRGTGVPPASDFAGSDPPLVVDGTTGTIYSITDAGVVVATSQAVFYAPASVTKNTGGTLTGAVSTVQTMLDGNVMSLVEVTGVPGYDLQFDWSGVVGTPAAVVYRARYDGLATHLVTLQLWSYAASAWKDVTELVTTMDYDVRTVTVPVFTNFISGGAAKARFYHATSGNGAHTLYIDYIGLMV